MKSFVTIDELQKYFTEGKKEYLNNKEIEKFYEKDGEQEVSKVESGKKDKLAILDNIFSGVGIAGGIGIMGEVAINAISGGELNEPLLATLGLVATGSAIASGFTSMIMANKSGKKFDLSDEEVKEEISEEELEKQLFF